MILLNALFPVLALILFGAAVKHWRITDEAFLRTSDRLVYFVFFPLMLFWKIGSAPLQFDGGWRYLPASALAVLAVCCLSLVFIRLLPVAAFKAGSFNQGCYRFNTYIGMAVVINAFGEAGVQLYGILIGLIIPMINVLCVSVLIWYGEDARNQGNRLTATLKHLLANPLIIACVAGILYSRMIGSFTVPIDNTLKLMSQVTLPLALFSIGGSLTFCQSPRQHGVGPGLGCVQTGGPAALGPAIAVVVRCHRPGLEGEHALFRPAHLDRHLHPLLTTPLRHRTGLGGHCDVNPALLCVDVTDIISSRVRMLSLQDLDNFDHGKQPLAVDPSHLGPEFMNIGNHFARTITAQTKSAANDSGLFRKNFNGEVVQRDIDPTVEGAQHGNTLHELLVGIIARMTGRFDRKMAGVVEQLNDLLRLEECLDRFFC